MSTETVEMRASKYWSQRQDARRERDEALVILAQVKERCAQMRFWGDAGRHAATFIENALARPSAPEADLKREGEVERLNRAITRVLVLIAPESPTALPQFLERYFAEADIRAALDEGETS